MDDKKCCFDYGKCDGNCSTCAGANYMFGVLEQSQREDVEREKRYNKLLKK